jgi:hypothetical protein
MLRCGTSKMNCPQQGNFLASARLAERPSGDPDPPPFSQINTFSNAAMHIQCRRWVNCVGSNAGAACPHHHRSRRVDAWPRVAFRARLPSGGSAQGPDFRSSRRIGLRPRRDRHETGGACRQARESTRGRSVQLILGELRNCPIYPLISDMADQIRLSSPLLLHFVGAGQSGYCRGKAPRRLQARLSRPGIARGWRRQASATRLQLPVSGQSVRTE